MSSIRCEQPQRLQAEISIKLKYETQLLSIVIKTPQK